MCAGCKKFLDVGSPRNERDAEDIYKHDTSAAAVVTGIYQAMSAQNCENYSSVGNLPNLYTTSGLSADELVLFDEASFFLRPYYTNNLLSAEQQAYWVNIYATIYVANAVIEGVGNSKALTPAVRTQLMGEAKFIRAFNYFYLVNFYGDVPLALTTDYQENIMLPRAPKAQVYEQIVTDLTDAENLLHGEYLKGDVLTPYGAGNAERVRPTKWAAAALLARVLLYTGKFADAEAKAGMVIGNRSLYELTTLENTFLSNNREAIWQLQALGVGSDANTGEGKFFILPEQGPGVENPVCLSESLLKSFEEDDLRKTKWIGYVVADGIEYYYPFKYKKGPQEPTTSEYATILRLSEQYLIRAEARAQQGDLAGAAEDLNTVRKRAGLPPTNAVSGPGLLAAILHERRVELFTEWGHRWFDLIRTGNAGKVLGPLKGADWQTTDQLFPIPQSEILRSPNLKGRQNPGYD
jgi:hypothetical protein